MAAVIISKSAKRR